MRLRHEVPRDRVGRNRLVPGGRRLLSWPNRDGDVLSVGSTRGMERRQDRTDRAHLPGTWHWQLLHLLCIE